ncbi:MAG: hypothetical protein Aurels2KO_19100 [Aureliella sp.]
MSQSNAGGQETQYTDVLFDCMQKRVDLARNLWQLNQTQTAAALENETDALMGILARKQGLLDALGEIQAKLQPYLSDDPDARVWSSQERRQQCRANAEESQRMLADLMRAEKATLDEVTARREAIGALLRDGMDAISTRDAYAQSATSGGRLDIGGI